MITYFKRYKRLAIIFTLLIIPLFFGLFFGNNIFNMISHLLPFKLWYIYLPIEVLTSYLSLPYYHLFYESYDPFFPPKDIGLFLVLATLIWAFLIDLLINLVLKIIKRKPFSLNIKLLIFILIIILGFGILDYIIVNFHLKTPIFNPSTFSHFYLKISEPTPGQISDWKIFKSKYFGFKYPPSGVVIAIQEEAKGPSFGGQFVPDINKDSHEQPHFVVAAYDRKVIETDKTLQEIIELDQQLNATLSADTKILSKTSSIMIFGKKGYEYYLESAIYQSFLGRAYSSQYPITIQSKFGKHRVVQFENDDKIYLIFESQDPQVKGIINTLKIF